MSSIKSYSDLVQFDSFIDRFRYLKLNGQVSDPTFGSTRYLNQVFYSSPEWKRIRQKIIIRDEGRDLGVEGYDIYGRICIHHINPITLFDIEDRSSKLLDPDNLVCVSFDTHEAIHYGDESLLKTDPIIRKPNDTCPWKK